MIWSVTALLVKVMSASAGGVKRKAPRKTQAAYRGRRQVVLGLEELESRFTPAAPMAVSSYFNNAIYEFDSGTGAFLQTLVAPNSSALLSGPSGMTVGPDGNLYISSQNNNSILEYNLQTGTLSTFISSTVLQAIANASGGTSTGQFAPSGLAFGPDGNLYVAENGGSSSTSGGAVIGFSVSSAAGVLSYNNSFTTVATGMVQPTGLTFGTASGDTASLYVTDSAADDVFKVADATTSPNQSKFITALAAAIAGMEVPTGLTWGPDGNLYVVDRGTDSGQGNVFQFAPNGKFNEIVTPETGPGDLNGQNPTGIAFTGPASMLTANLGGSQSQPLGSIDQYNTDGTFIGPLVSDTGVAGGGMYASQIAILPDAAPIAVASYFDGAVYQVNSQTGAVEKTLIASNTSTVVDGIAGMTVGPDGNIYISSELNNSIVQLNPSTGAQTVFISSTVLQAIAPPQNSSTGTSGQFAPSGLVFGPDGDLYVVENGGLGASSGGAVIRFGITSTGGALSYNNTYTTVATGMDEPSALTFGTAAGDTNSFYVSDSDDDVIYKVANATGSPTQSTYINFATATYAKGVVQKVDFPAGLSWGPDDDLYIVDLAAFSGQGNVFQYDPNTASINVITPSGVTNPPGDLDNQYPSGILFDPEGNVLTANLGATYPPTLSGSVYQYNTNGSFQDLVSSSQFADGISASLLAQMPITNSAPTVTTNPANETIDAGANTSFTAAATNGAPVPTTVQWQVSTNNGVSFSNLSNNVIYGGVTSTTLTITGAAAALNGDEYQAVFNNAANLPATTTAATLIVDFAPTVTTNPTTSTIDAGAGTSFSAAATNGFPAATTVQWQVSTNNGVSFSNLSASVIYGGVTSTTLTITGATAAMNGDEYQAVFNNTANLPVATSAATLIVDFAPTVTTDPVSASISTNQGTTFTAAATDGYPVPTTVQWQVSTNNGVSFSNISTGGFYGGVMTTTLTITGATTVLNGDEYRAVFSNAANLPANTTAATLTVSSNFAPTVTTDPTNSSIDVGLNTSFTAAATAGFPTATTVQWQVSTNNGVSFSNLSNSAIYGGVTATTLTITGATAAMSGDEYQAVFNNAANLPAATTAATLTVTPNSAPTITTDPTNSSIDAGASTSFSAAAANGSPTPTTVQWQVSTNNGVSFSNLSTSVIYGGVTSTTLTITDATAALNGDEYQAVFNNAANLPAATTAATLTVDFAPTITTNPISASINTNQGTTFTAAATAGFPTATTVQWQVSTNNGVSFSNISNGGFYGGVMTTTLTISEATTALNGDKYQAVFNNAANLPATTTAATLTVSSNFAPTVTTNPTNSTVNSGANTSFTAAATDGSPTPTTVQWQVSTNNGVSFNNLSNGVIYGGVTTTTLTITGAAANLNERHEYRAVFSNAANLPADTTAATLTIASYDVGDFAGSGIFFYDAGTSAWERLTPSDPTVLGVSAGGTVIANFKGYGVDYFNLSQFNPAQPVTWTALVPAAGNSAPSILSVAANGVVAAVFAPYGAYLYDPANPTSGWQQLATSNPSLLSAGGIGTETYVVGEFAPYGVNLYEYNSTSPNSPHAWVQLTASNASLLAVNSNGNVYADFKGYGLQLYVSGTTWESLGTPDATSFAVDSLGQVVADLDQTGLYQYSSSTGWVSLHTSNASLLTLNVDGEVVGDFPPYGVQIGGLSGFGYLGYRTGDASLLATSQG